MSVATFLDKIVSPLRKRKEERLSDFKALALAVAQDKDVSVDEVERILNMAGKTAEQLAEAAELLANRKKWRAKCDLFKKTNVAERAKDAETMQLARAAHAAAISRADDELERIRVPLFTREQERDRLEREAALAESELRKTADPSAIAALLLHNQESERRINALAELRNDISGWRREAGGQAEVAANAHLENDKPHAAARAEKARQKLAELEGQLPAMEAMVAPLLKQRADLELALLDV
jgi:hypothetical protein